MTLQCETVAERVALGEPLAELDEHVSSCERCQRLVAVTAQLGATKHAVDPGLGFSARMTVGAQHRIAVRRRRRIAVGLAATVAAGMVGLFAFTRDAAQETQPVQPAVAENLPIEEHVEIEADDLAALVDLADTKRSSRLSAHWARIYKPLEPYRQLVEEGDAP